MTSSPVPESENNKNLRRRFTKTHLILLFALVGIFSGMMVRFASKTADISQPTDSRLAKKTTPSRSHPTIEASSAVVAPEYPTLSPEPMRLLKKVLAGTKWNSGPNAFGLDKPPVGQEGATVGPAAVAYAQDRIHVLDNVNKRILRFDLNGNPLSSVVLATGIATDLAIDATGSSLLVIDHLNDRIYKVEGDEATFLAQVSMKKDFPLGTKFSYDAEAHTLLPQNLEQDGLARIDGNNIVLGLSNNEKLAIAFDKPVACVEEMLTDGRGIVWVLYTLEGDYRMRRVARVDRAQGTVGVAEIDVWFPFDATRHMAATQNGVVLFAGDQQEGRLVSFDYKGGDF